MKVIVFDQWERLVAKFRSMAESSARQNSQYAVSRVEPKNGKAHLADRTVNDLAITGGRMVVVIPDIDPGKARDFILRITAAGVNELSFEGAEAFESDDPDALAPPGDGETAIYVFTEVAADIFLVTRRSVNRIAGE